ncbi:MAG: T9SS type A sorting domain-containing protein [Bacteroidetes bacterium]|nr:T9SS type A sorting domain-containing protein [Bacteroidota bacterium]
MHFSFAKAQNGNCYIVAKTGSNSNAGNIAHPWLTINFGIGKLKAGDTLLVREGIYKETVLLSVSGSSDKNIVLKNFPEEVPEINGWINNALSNSGGIQSKNYSPEAYISNYVIEGFYITGFRYGGININWCGTCDPAKGDLKGINIIVKNCIIDDCGQNGISVFFSENVVIENNIVSRTGWDTLSGSWSSGINLYAAHGNCTINGNVSFHNVDVSKYNTDGNGFIVDLSYDHCTASFTNNIAFANGGAGIVVTKSNNAKIINNTCYFNGQGNDAGDFTFAYPEAFVNTQLINNLASDGKHGALKQYQGNLFTNLSSTVFNNNLYPGNYGGIAPLFEDVSPANFKLQASCSLIDAGHSTTLQNDIGFDYKSIKAISKSKRFSWYTHEPDIAYIKSKGGLIHCFQPVSRTNNTVDIGAYEFTNTLTSNEMLPSKNEIQIFPNPSSSQFTIYSTSEIKNKEVVIYNSVGQAMMTLTLNSAENNTFEASSLSAGLYFVKIENQILSIVIRE